MSKSYSELTVQYPCFIYHDYVLNIDNDTLTIEYHFEIQGLASFAPKWTIPLAGHEVDLNDQTLKNYIFALGMIETISYWKITCSPTLIVKAGYLDGFQIDWFKKIMYYGLGEFFYQNKIHLSIDDFVTFQIDAKPVESNPVHKQVSGQLIPVGGGKDSYVTLEVMKQDFDNSYAFVINDVISALNAVEVSGYKDKFIHVHRTLDVMMLNLNKEGYLNGHTPFSALVAFSSSLVAYIYGLQYIVLSNEESANESTIANEKINHQYSKSFEFEQDFHWYSHHYLNPNILYYSLLRCLNELQITDLFVHIHKYLLTFRSCNVGSKQGIWCGHCAKCCFVAIMLAAFMDDEQIIEIFGKDILNDESLWPLFTQLIGIVDDKPFECVGTRGEVNAATILALQRREGKPLNYILSRLSHYVNQEGDVAQYLNYENHDTLVPKIHYNYLKKYCVWTELWKQD